MAQDQHSSSFHRYITLVMRSKQPIVFISRFRCCDLALQSRGRLHREKRGKEVCQPDAEGLEEYAVSLVVYYIFRLGLFDTQLTSQHFLSNATMHLETLLLHCSLAILK